MHVLLTTDTLGGVWNYTQELASSLIKRGIKVTLVSFGEIPAPEKISWMDELPGLDFLPTGFPLEWMQDAQRDVSASMEFLQALISEVSPDVLHLNQYCYGALKTSVPRVVVAHSDVVGWWQAVHGTDPPPTRWLEWYRATLQRGLQAASVVVAPSKWMLSSLSSNFGPHPNSRVIYNGRDPKRFNPHVSKEDYALTVGRVWDSGKQVVLLCQPDLPMRAVIAGCEQHPELSLRNLGCNDPSLPNVQFVGMQSEAQLRQLYSRAAIYVAASRYEPFGLAPLEAALSRCCIVVNDVDTFHELWGDAALYFERNNAADLARKLRFLKDEPDLRREYANLAYQRALAQFNADRMADEYLKLYLSLIAAPAMAA